MSNRDTEIIPAHVRLLELLRADPATKGMRVHRDVLARACVDHARAVELLKDVEKKLPSDPKDFRPLLRQFADLKLARGEGRVISVDGSPYLTRIFLEQGKPEFGAFLHCFHKGDQVRDFHSHPWEWGMSYILTGSYSEERFEFNPEGPPHGAIVKHNYREGQINVLGRHTYHRVDLPEGGDEVWTLFIRGPRVQGWGFYNRETGEQTPMNADETTND